MSRYIFKRPDSPFWWLKLQGPNGNRRFSLQTTDKATAEIRAAPYIVEHKRELLAARPHVVPEWRYDFEPGRVHDLPDGRKVLATAELLTYFDASGAVIGDPKPNGREVFQITGAPRDLERSAVALRWHNTVQQVIREHSGARPARATRSDDDALIEKYIAHGKSGGPVSERRAHEARQMWELFKTVCPKVRLASATRDHGRKLVAYLASRGDKKKVKSATVQKKVNALTAACNFAIKEGDLKFNPFSAVAPTLDDAVIRPPFNDDDMALIRAKLSLLAERDRLMVKLLAATGMRLGECYQINGEQTEQSIRYFITGSKNEQSLRRVPLPADLLPLPKIKGRLFPCDDAEKAAKAASARINDWLEEECGIARPKVVHSFRHRAQDRLRAAECPQDLRWALLGHEKKSVAEGYGEGYPVTVLKKWIDKIGF